MTEPDHLPQPALSPALRASSKNLFLLLLLTLIYCSPATFASASTNEQRPGAVAGPPNSFGEPDGFWSSDGVLFQKGTGDLGRLKVGDETAIAEAIEVHGSQFREFHGGQNREIHGAQEARNSAKYGADNVWQPSAKPLRNYNQENQFTVPQNFDHADKGESVRTAINEEFTSPRTLKIQGGRSEGQELQGDIRQGNCAQEAPECKRVSSRNKSNGKIKEIRHEYPVITWDKKMRSSESARQKEAQPRSEREVDPNTNKRVKKYDEDNRQPLLLGEDGNDPTDNIKRGQLLPLSLSPDTQDAAHRKESFLHDFHKDGKHAEHNSASTSGLHTPGGSRKEFTSASTSAIYIPSASPVAAPPRNGPWHSLQDTTSGGSPLVDVTYQMPSGSLNSGSLDGSRTMGQYGDHRPAWETSSEDYHSPDYLGGPMLHLSGAAPPSLTRLVKFKCLFCRQAVHRQV